MFPGAPAYLQARDQAGAKAVPDWGVRGCTQGGVHQVQDKPKEGEETCD